MDRALTVQHLVDRGFELLGCWEVDHAQALALAVELPKAAGVYAFAIDGVVQYVGVASKSLHQRFKFYVKPGLTQATSIRLNDKLRTLIANGHRIDILVAHPPDGEWNGLPLSGAEGLESGLIKAFDLPWNIRGAAKRPTENEAMKPLRQRQSNVRDRILEQIRKRPGMTELELAKFIYGPSAQQPQANSHCRALVAAKLVERRGSGGISDPFVYYPKR